MFANSCQRICETIAIEAWGIVGGLSILWDHAHITPKHFLTTRYTITGNYHEIGTSKFGTLTNVYGPHHLSKKYHFLHSLPIIQTLLSCSKWIIAGDFNLITSLGEDKGGIRKLDQHSKCFGQLINQIQLVDIHTVNGTHTWNNKCGGSHQIASRLDRFLISEHLMQTGMPIEASIIPQSSSDHQPINLTSIMDPIANLRPFRFENLCLSHRYFQANIQKSWQATSSIQGNTMSRFQQRLKALKAQLKTWNKTVFGNISRDKSYQEEQLRQIQQAIVTEGRMETLSQQGKHAQQKWEIDANRKKFYGNKNLELNGLKKEKRKPNYFIRLCFNTGIIIGFSP